MARLILDTTILIDAERGPGDFDEVIGDDDDVAVAAVTVAELLVGVELAGGKRRAARKRYVDELIDTIAIEPYDLDVARAHAMLLGEVRKTGTPRGAHDLIIAATAAARDRTIVTGDLRGFADLPSIVVVVP